MNNRDNSFTIPANQAQDLLNVNVIQGGKSVKKRPGYAQAFALAQTTSPVHGTYLFYNSAGNDVVLAFNDAKITSSVSGGSATVIYSTATFGSTFQCSDYLGFAYCADSSRDGLFKTDGVTVTPVTTISSTGTMVAACPTRLAMAGFSGSPARIDLSADTDFMTWGTGSLGSSPVQLTITSPGSRITHITYAFGRLMWFKETSFGYVLIGNQPLQTDWVIKTISNTIGTLDNSSTQDFNGNLYFRGQDGHIYVFDGANVVKLSREIAGTVSSAQTRASNSVTVSGASGFNAGTYTGNTFFIDTQTVSGNLQTTFPDPFNSYRNGTSSTKSVWTSFTDSGSTGSITCDGNLNITDTGTNYAWTWTQIGAVSAGVTVQAVINSIPVNSTELYEAAILISTTQYSGSKVINPFISTDGNWVYSYYSTSTNLAQGSLFQNQFDPTANLGTVGPFTIPLTFQLWLATNTFTYSVNGSVIKSGSHTWPNPSKTCYVYLGFTSRSASVTQTGKFDNFTVIPETFSWTSGSQTVSSAITSWDSFTASKNDTAGSITFGVRSANTDSYTSITSGQVPTISTKTFWQVTSTFTVTSTSTLAVPVSLTSVTQNWFEGTASDKAYAGFFDDKVMFSVPIGSGQSTNNRILVYDLLYQGWTLWDLPVNGFYIRNNALYFGSSNGGYLFKYGVGNNDNGSAINAYWKSKDFFGADPFTTQEIANISVAANSIANSSMTVTYTLNGNTSTSYTMGFGSGNGFMNKNSTLPAGVLGSEFNVKFGNNAVDQPFEVFGVQVGIRERPWIPN